ncbi:MAG: RrF2 family transcriptional regulator [Caldimicrobium sp.]|jgi:Rrf2 family protein|uniref:Rrf2 family transcriptional regulator n=1 Tax=Caldimicrobium thiodismutans TaxID=1653476 RepID=A0A2N7PK71_9BACT|nr:MAG: Rrf2 family transcriptional regulator [Caldimicrobium thiodismutans]
MEFGIIEDYAVRMVLYLSRNPEKISSRQEISQAMQIPISVLARIGQILEAGGIVEIQRGKKGGYRLRKPPEKITLLEVIESFVGKIAINKCVDNPNFCVREGICPVNFVWKEINEKFRELLKIDFKTLLEKERTLLQNK